MKIRFFVLTAVLMTTTALSLGAQAGPRVGNGGGAWICKDKTTQEDRWIQLVDLFEAQNEFNYPAADQTQLNYWQIIDQKVAEIQSSIPELQLLLTRTPEQIKAILHMVPDSSSLTRVDDGHIRVHPTPESCENGYIFYGQLANFTDDGRLLVDGGIWQNAAFHEIDRAALLMHEVIYKSLRDTRGDTNSSRSRQIVGILFSAMDSQTKSIVIHKVLQTPAPIDDASVIILDPYVLTCKAAVQAADGGYTPYPFKSPIMGGESVSTSIGDYEFRITTDRITGIPTLLSIYDRILHVGTSLGSDVIQAVITSKHEVGITLDNHDSKKTALLNCHIQIFPQN